MYALHPYMINKRTFTASNAEINVIVTIHLTLCGILRTNSILEKYEKNT